MKKNILFIAAVIIVLLSASACGNSENKVSPSSSPTPTPTPSVTTSAKPDNNSNTNDTDTEKSSAIKKDSADVDKINHEEVEKMISDIQELINDGLYDDANMAIRDLLTHNLTEDERNKVEALQSKTIEISD